MTLQANTTPAHHPKKSAGLTVIDSQQKEQEYQCEKHGAYMGLPFIGFKGKVWAPTCPRCLEDHENDQRRHEEAERQLRIENMISESGIPKRFKACLFGGYDVAASEKASSAFSIVKKYADSFDKLSEKGCSLVLCGLPGTGKTHLACAAANQLLAEGVSVKYTTAFKMFAAVKSTYSRNTDETEDRVIKSFLRPSLLIIDEVGMQFNSESEKIILFQVVNGRYEDVLPTIIISNLPEEELSQYMGERCLDRMREGGGAVIPFEWKSFRR